MYTCCPICKTNFNVTEAQLRVAQGKVRCGSCKNVFNARQHINYRSPVSTKSTPPIAKPATPQNTEAETKPGMTTKSHVIQTNNTVQPPERTTRQATTTPSPYKQADTPTAAKQNSTSPKSAADINISAIFNALDTQLSQGTYLDISKPAEVDIREAAFDEIFEDDNEHLINNNQILGGSETEIDLDVSDKISLTETGQPGVKPRLEDSPLKSEIFKPLNHIHARHQEPSVSEHTVPEKELLDKAEDNIQQHAFDFISLAEEPDLSARDKEQLAVVNKPLPISSATKENSANAARDRAALHQAIDNIIKVDSSIPTPFEENDEHHFVINVETEPDVQLVDENDLDKLFASTDSLKISDLKFDKYKTTKEDAHVSTTNQNKIKAEVEPEYKTDLKLELDESELSSFNNQVEENVKPDNFSAESLTTDDFSADDFNPEYPDSDNIDIEDKIDDTEFDIDFGSDIDPGNVEEEIILSSPEEESAIPHRLRDAVASLEPQPVRITKRILYYSAIIIFSALIVIQLVLFKSTTLANMFPALQPLLVSACQRLPCRYTGNHNSKQIEIVNRDVRQHPKIKGALLISATIINQATYTQPYPTILLKFTDLTGATVAQRYFQPREYLGLLNKPFAMMPSKQPIQLNIEILDPGNDAINFQFFFL